jgi:hypothetical protein
MAALVPARRLFQQRNALRRHAILPRQDEIARLIELYGEWLTGASRLCGRCVCFDFITIAS